MANKIKFEMTLKELTFKFEGDYEHGQRLQLGINKALSDLGKLQGAASGAEEIKLIEATPVVARTSRRRKRKNEQGDAATDNGKEGTGEADVAGSDSDRRSLGVSPTKLLMDMRKNGGFQDGKTSAQIVSDLNRSGHTAIKDSDLTSPLIRLCTRQVLKRDKPAGAKSWIYAAGPKDE